MCSFVLPVRMSRSHGYRFANDVLPETLFDNPLAFARTISNQRQGLQLLASAWDRAGATMPACDRASRSGLNLSVAPRGAFLVIHILVPPPREHGDPTMIVIVGQGDGQSRFDSPQYFVLELGADARFHIVMRMADDEQGHDITARACGLGIGAAPDGHSFIEQVCEYVARRQPPAPRMPTVPAWYWWHAFGGAEAMIAWLSTRDPVTTVMRDPILLLPEIVDSSSVFLTGGATAQGLPEVRHQMQRDGSFAPAAHQLAMYLANSKSGVAPANLGRAIALLAEAREYGGDRNEACAIEAEIRQKLAALGIDVRKNYEEAQRLRAMAQSQAGAVTSPAQEQPPQRVARGSSAGIPRDPTFGTLFLDGSELPYFQRGELTELDACGGLIAGSVTWMGRDDWAMSRIIDTRWLFASAAAADQFLRGAMHAIGDWLPQTSAPQLGDVTLAYGSPRAAQILVFRIGRMVGRLAVAQGAAASDPLEQVMLLPYAQRAVQRAQWNLSRYWLTVGHGNDAATMFTQAPNPRLLAEYPILALPEFPAAMATLGGPYAQGAQILWQLQQQLRGQQWQAHRDATVALVRALLDDRASDTRVNAAHAMAIVDEIRRLDSDPIWIQLDAECRAKA